YFGYNKQQRRLDQEKIKTEQEVTLENEDVNEYNCMEKEGENISREARNLHDKMSEMEDPDDSNYITREKRIHSESDEVISDTSIE
ncbi:hypothetical protein ILUMI_17586, partial [Ignelater luminosus]